jgi:cytoskeletal protein CcmA (bactofilin family)
MNISRACPPEHGQTQGQGRGSGGLGPAGQATPSARVAKVALACYPDAAMDALPASEITALLGRGTRYEGKLFFEGRVRIDGVFKGEIKSDDTLVIGDGAEVHAEIDVATVIIRGGVVHGNVRASTALEIHAPGKLIGNIHSPSVFLERGVEFQGSCRMDALDGDKPEARAEKDKPAREVTARA